MTKFKIEDRSGQSEVLWFQEALTVRARAYAPYSHIHVGAVVVTVTGKIFTGCTVENASSDMTICAERVAVCKMISEVGAYNIAAVMVVTQPPPGADVAFPCAACLTVLAQFSVPETTVIVSDLEGNMQEATMLELLPDLFETEFRESQ